MRYIKIFIGLACFLSAVGCATNVNTVEREQSRSVPKYVSDKRIITDQTLADLISVVSVNESTVSGNLKKVQIKLENAMDNTARVSYKFEWIDQDGMATNSILETWQPIVLLGRETVTVSSVAVSPKAVDFKLKLVESK